MIRKTFRYIGFVFGSTLYFSFFFIFVVILEINRILGKVKNFVIKRN